MGNRIKENRMITKTARSVKKRYEDLQESLISHWVDLQDADSKSEKKFLSEYGPSNTGYWFGDVSYIDIFSQKLQWINFEKSFPVNLSNLKRRSQLMSEFNYLFPCSPLTENFLPVLLSSFFLNSSENKPIAKNLFTIKGPMDIKSSVKELTLIPRWEVTYKKLLENKKARKVSTKNLGRAFAIYRRIIIFFLFMKAADEIANIPLSFYTFQAMTGYLELLDTKATNLVSILDGEGPLKLFEYEQNGSVMTNNILEYIDETLDEFCKMQVDLKREPIYFSNSFLVFLGNLRGQLYDHSEEYDRAIEKGEGETRVMNKNKRKIDSKVPVDDSDFFAALDEWRSYVTEKQRNYHPADNPAIDQDIVDLTGLLMKELEKPEYSQD